MKKTILTAVLALVTVVAFGQKREIKRAGNAVEDGEFQKAKEYLKEAEAELSGADQDEKADYHLYLGYALLGDGQNLPNADIMAAAEAFKKAKELGNAEAQQGMAAVSNALVNAAIADQNAERYADASEKLFTSYQLNKQDTIYLYYAAANAVNAKNYDKALEYYEELRDLGFTGKETVYTAVNVETGEVEQMASKEQRDLFVKSGSYRDPQQSVGESRKPEIAKNIALIYIDKGQQDKAIKAMELAKKENPGDISLLQAEADMFYKMGDMAKYRELMEEVVAQDPDNATLYFNLGVSSAELGENERAIEYYKKAIELDPEMTNARINMAYTILAKEAPLVEQMNSLGMSKADTQKYEELSKQRQELYSEALPHLQKVFENDPQNVEVARTIMNIHYQLQDPKKAEEWKQKVADLESGTTSATSGQE